MEAHPEHVHGEAIVDVIQRKIGVSVAKLRPSLGSGTGERGIRSLAEVHVVVLRCERPRPLYIVIDSEADVITAGLVVLAAAEEIAGSRVARGSVGELRRMLSGREGAAHPKVGQPLIHRVPDPRAQQEDSVRAHLAGRGIGTGRNGIGGACRRIDERARVALAADGIIIRFEPPNPLVVLKVVPQVYTADEIAIVGTVAIVKLGGKFRVSRYARTRVPARAGVVPRSAYIAAHVEALPRGVLHGYYILRIDCA